MKKCPKIFSVLFYKTKKNKSWSVFNKYNNAVWLFLKFVLTSSESGILYYKHTTDYNS